MARNYKSATGGIEIIKKEPTEKEKEKNSKAKEYKMYRMVEDLNSQLDKEKILETLISYMPGDTGVQDGSSRGVCLICGKETAFANRHVCVDCMKEHKKELYEAIKPTI